MRPLKVMIAMTAGAFLLASIPGVAQAQTPPAKPPAQTPATPPPAAKPPADKPPAPFPEGAKIAYVNIQYIASNSAEGKAASKKLDDLKKKKNDELLAKQKALQDAQDKLQKGGSVMSDQARAQAEKEIEKMQRELQFANQDANTEVQDMTNQLQNDFQEKLSPIVEALRAEKGLQIIFSVADSGIVAAELGLDLSAEVVKRFDAAGKTPAKK
jgi:outer membrane protein